MFRRKEDLIISYGFDVTPIGIELSNKIGECWEGELINLNISPSKYKLIGLISLIISFLCVPFIFLYGIIKVFIFSNLKDQSFFYCFLRFKLFNVMMGDMVLSSLLKDRTNGYLKQNLYMYILFIKILIKFLSFKFYIKYLKLIYKENKYFIDIDRIYMFEIVRRLLISENFKEIVFNRITGKYDVLDKPYYGYQLLRGEYYRKYINTITKNDLEKARNRLLNLINRKITYKFLEGCDINVKKSYLKDNFISKNDKVAIIYMHNVSDAQYFFGIDEFIDLHDWLIYSYKTLLEYGYKVIIKPHPSFYSNNNMYPVDKRYLTYLSKYFGIDLWNMDKNSLNKTQISNVFFLYYEYSSKFLSEKYKNHLVITHHGKIALELSYLEHVVLVSKASPYYENTFIKIYNNKKEYLKFIEQFANNKLDMKINKNKLFEYIFIYQIVPKKEIYEELVERFNYNFSRKEIIKYLDKKVKC
jgi:hypothetical protein